MQLKEKLQDNKARLEKKLEEKRKERDKAKKEILDFPNLTIPLFTVSFLPAFLALAIAGTIKGCHTGINTFAIMMSLFGIVSLWTLCHPGNSWFTYYGTKGILKNRVPIEKELITAYVLCCVAIIAAGLFVKSMTGFTLYLIAVAIGAIKLGISQTAVLWDTPPILLLGFRKYRFIPQNGDKYAVYGQNFPCVIRNANKFRDDNALEGTYIGNGWFLLKEKQD